MRKIFFIRATVTPIELLLPVRTGTGGRRSRWLSGPLILLLTNQQAFEPLRSLRLCVKIENKPMIALI